MLLLLTVLAVFVVRVVVVASSYSLQLYNDYEGCDDDDDNDDGGGGDDSDDDDDDDDIGESVCLDVFFPSGRQTLHLTG